MKKQFYHSIRLVLFSLGLISCGTSNLKNGERLYTGAEINIESDELSKSTKNELKEGLQAKVTPKPNMTFLGLRPKLFINNLVGDTDKEKGIKHWIKEKLGEEPVLLEDVDREFNRDIIVNYAENKGFFNASATYDTVSKKKTAKVIYKVKPRDRYMIREVGYQLDSTDLGKEISKLTQESLLKKGNPFDLDVIKAERERIDSRLKERGFYYFHPDNIIVEADSTVSKDAKVDLTAKIKNSIPELAKRQFRINKVVVFADYNINDLKTQAYDIPYNTDSLEVYDDMYIIDPKHKFKPKMFDRALQFQKGELYNRTDHNLTLNRLISLGVYKFVKNEFFIADSLQNKFDVYYLLTPNEMQSLRLETNARSNSADYVGSEVNLNWTHKNIFKGAEQLRFSIFGSFDKQVGGKRDANNIYRVGMNAELSIPRLITPFKVNTRGAFVPRTNANIGYEFLNRSRLYSLHTFNTSFGYLWKENIRKEHELKILDASLVYPQNVTQRYDSIMQGNPFLQRVVEDQLIYGPTYSYTYTTTMRPIDNTIYYKGILDLAGNLTGLILGADAKAGKQKKIFDIPFSQFAKMEHDFRFYHDFSQKHSLATRIIAGIAYPYGNSEYIPFSKQFFAGGTNSIRSFRARTLGPGSYNPENQNTSFYFDQGGDIRLELNAEYRANLWKFLNAAVFVDAGNIWLVNEDPDRPGARISKDWYKEIAVGAGVGLRLDFSILILRLDLATPIRIPYYPENNRWTFDKIDFGDKDWRKDNLILNIAIGYPF